MFHGKKMSVSKFWPTYLHSLLLYILLYKFPHKNPVISILIENLYYIFLYLFPQIISHIYFEYTVVKYLNMPCPLSTLFFLIPHFIWHHTPWKHQIKFFSKGTFNSFIPQTFCLTLVPSKVRYENITTNLNLLHFLKKQSSNQDLVTFPLQKNVSQ